MEKEGGFQPIGTFSDLYGEYKSSMLFPLFATRMLSPSRPDYEDFVSWMGLSGTKIDPVELLARSGGKSVTDRFEIFPFPKKNQNGKYHSHFFAHGLRHLPASEDRVAVGYCPRYLLHHVKDIQSQSEKLCVKVEKDVSAEVPLSFRLLCSLTADWKENELPFNNPQYQPLIKHKCLSYTERTCTDQPSICRDGEK